MARLSVPALVLFAVVYSFLHLDAATAAPGFGHARRADFFFAGNYTQFNHGAYGGTPRAVISAQMGYIAQMEADIDPWMNSPTGYRSCIIAARTALSGMLGVPVNDTVLVDNASEAINDILRNFEPPLSADETIIDLSTAYGPFVELYGWLQERLGVSTVTIPISWPVSGPQSFTAPVSAFLAANASLLNIRCAIISHVSAYPSVLLPVGELVSLFHEYNIPVIVDGAHALGNVPNIDVVKGMSNPEYYFTNVHKWLFGPKSSAIMYVRHDQQKLHVPAPAVVDNLEVQDFPDRFIWTGTRDRSPYCAISDALAYRESIGGEAAIVEYTHSLAKWARHYLASLWNTPPMAPESMSTAMSLVQIPTANQTTCQTVRSVLMNSYNYSVSGWTPLPDFACYFRLSAQVYLEQSDFVNLGNAVLDIIASAEQQ